MRDVRTILVVDDEDHWLRSFDEKMGSVYEVTMANDLTCMDFVEEKSYDVVVVDLAMEHRSGDEISEAIRSCDRRSLIVAWTALPSRNRTVKSISKQGVHVFSKHGELAGVKAIRDGISAVMFREAKDLSALVVDDEKERRDHYGKCLQDCRLKEHCIEFAETIDHAERLVQVREFDLILIDMMFPEGPSGLDFARRLATDVLARAVVFLVSADYDGKRRLRRLSGLEGVLTLPIHQRTMLEKTIEEAIERGPYRVESGA